MKPADHSTSTALDSAHRHAVKYIGELNSGRVGASASLERLRELLGRPLADGGCEPERVIDELVTDAADGLHRSSGGRFFGWVIGGAVPSALAADWLTSTWDQNSGMYSVAPAAAVVEEVAGGWLKELLNLRADASFALVTGCQMAHVTALAAARNEVLARHDWDVERQGLFGAPPVRILCSDQKHGSVVRAARLLGFGEECLRDVETTRDGTVVEQALNEALLESANAPTIVVLQAGDINTGAFDDFEPLINLAHNHGAWVHIDGAFGLWAAASPKYRHLTRGAKLADSWATDGHKWLNVPYDCGYAFTACPRAHSAAMSHRASYLVYDDAARDQIDWNPEFSRRGRGFATYAAIRELGKVGIASLVDRCCEHAKALVAGIGQLDGAEVLAEPIINQGLIRFHQRAGGDEAEQDDRFTDSMINAINASGKAFFTGSTWRGRRVMRVSVSNWRTSADDIDRSIQAVADTLTAIRLS